MTNRVKYYPANDILHGHNFSKIEALHVPTFDSIDINDAIEFFQINKYFAAGTRCRSWDDKEYAEYKLKADQLSGLTKRFFNQIDNDNIIACYTNIEFGYHSDFWVLFDNCKLYNKITDDIFGILINSPHIYPHDLFLHKNIVRSYGNVLRSYIIGNAYCIPTILHVYEQDYTECEKLTLPTELTGEDICNYIESYIDSEHPNVNYLREIVDMHWSSRFPISDEVRLKAKKRYEKEIEKISKNGFNISQTLGITFDPEQNEVKIGTHSDNEFHISYSTKWLLETLDYPSILNNFIYVFEFVDVPQMRCSHVNRISESGILERIFTPKSSKKYPHNHAFDFFNNIALMQMHAYYDFLGKQGIRLEDVIKWFFTVQLQTEFRCPEMRLTMPSPNSTYSEKCSTIITAFESALKQFSLYVKKGEIDFELVSMSTTPILFTDIKSMIADKYIYGLGDEYKRLIFWFFSDQCMFTYVERIHDTGHSYDCFYDLLLNEDIYLSDYREEEHSAFELMAKHDLVAINADKKITPKNKIRLTILRDLFLNGVISQWHYPTIARESIDYFISNGIIEAKSTLFSQPEIDYLNYLLNRAEYSNGLEIRNRYIHGILQVSTDENEHRQNYYTLLRLFILLAIKVNDEFCLVEDTLTKSK